jgi:ribosome biogenesis SPOUT family RNA methylase Rps3
MKITISELIEHEDGSATYKVDTDREGTELLVQEGLISLMTKALKDKEENESTAD